MTTTEHADLIERLKAELTHTKIVKRKDLFSESQRIAGLLSECLTALRTSRRDGWLDAADAAISDEYAAEWDPDDFAIVHDVADKLRRNAPQESD